jgi:predicted nucleic acid-binding protein
VSFRRHEVLLDTSVAYKWEVPESNSDKAIRLLLAEQEKCEFVTADDKLVNNVQKQFPFVRSSSTMP